MSTRTVACIGYDGMHQDVPVQIEIDDDAHAPSLTWVGPDGERARVMVDYYEGQVRFLVYDRRHMEMCQDGHITVAFDEKGFAKTVEVTDFYDPTNGYRENPSITVPEPGEDS